MNKILENRKIKNGVIVPIDLIYDEEEKAIRLTDDYIDISYGSKETIARVLSNLYPYKFNYFGDEVSSVEAAIQSLKYEDEKVRKTCYDYHGKDAWHLRGAFPYAWQESGVLYTPTGKINRYGNEYQDFLDELYFCVYQNPLYRNHLKSSYDKKLDHTIGEDDVKNTTLTRTEYISRLYALRYCAINDIYEKEDVLKVLRDVRKELES